RFECMVNNVDHRGRIAFRLGNEIHAPPRPLREGEPDERRGGFADCPILACFSDADDLIPGTAVAGMPVAFANSFGGRLQTGEEPAHESLVDDYDALIVRCVMLSEIAPGDERRTHRLEVTRPGYRG